MEAEPSVPSTTESRNESNRVLVEGLRALTRIVEYATTGEASYVREAEALAGEAPAGADAGLLAVQEEVGGEVEAREGGGVGDGLDDEREHARALGARGGRPEAELVAGEVEDGEGRAGARGGDEHGGTVGADLVVREAELDERGAARQRVCEVGGGLAVEVVADETERR